MSFLPFSLSHGNFVAPYLDGAAIAAMWLSDKLIWEFQIDSFFFLPFQVNPSGRYESSFDRMGNYQLHSDLNSNPDLLREVGSGRRVASSVKSSGGMNVYPQVTQ